MIQKIFVWYMWFVQTFWSNWNPGGGLAVRDRANYFEPHRFRIPDISRVTPGKCAFAVCVKHFEVQMSCPSWSKRMESCKEIQNGPNAPNATVSWSNSRAHFVLWWIEKILDLLSDMLWPALWDKFVQLFQPTHQFSWKLLLEHELRRGFYCNLNHQKVCAFAPLTFLSDSTGNGRRSQWTTATNCWKAPPAAPAPPASSKRPRALCAPYGSVVLPRPLGLWKWSRSSPEL